MFVENSVSDAFEKYSKDILNYSYSLLKDRDEAKDALQEVFMRYISARENFRGDCSEKTWLLTITRNYCLNIITRSHARRAELDASMPAPDNAAGLDSIITLKDALNKLPAEEYELLYLREYAGYSYKEISEILEISLDNVKIRLFRIRQKLKSYMK